MVVGAGGGAGWGSRRVSGAGVVTRGVALAAELSVQTLSWGGAGPVNIRGAVRGVRQCAEGCARVVTRSPGCGGAAHRCRDTGQCSGAGSQRVGREGGDAGVRGGRTRSRTLGHVDGTSEEPGTGRGAGGGAYAGRSGAGPRPERALLCSADSSRFFRERVLF